jgi:hypothetical protein
MNEIDGWATKIGEVACRYLSRAGHDDINGLLCSDGSSAAGWKLFVALIVSMILGVALFRVFRPNP